LLLGHSCRAGDPTIQRVPALRQFRGAEAKGLNSLRIENQSTGSRVSNEQAHFRIHFNLHVASILSAGTIYGHGFRTGKAQISYLATRTAADAAGDVVEAILDG
jgi:hypothetical protein